MMLGRHAASSSSFIIAYRIGIADAARRLVRLLHAQILLLAAEPPLQMPLGYARLALQKLLRGRACVLEQVEIRLKIREPQHWHAALPRAQQFTGTPHSQIVARNLEPVTAFINDFQAL